MIFINKRGLFKLGRTWSELTTKDRENPSGFTWISRYGSVTFNCFGKDLADGGMNEAGLFIWEMNEDPEYPKGTGLPRLDQMSWIQYMLDNYATTEEALEAAAGIEISGWGWHFFIGDPFTVDHLQMIGNNIVFTIRTSRGTLFEFKGAFIQDELVLSQYGIEDYYGTYTLIRK